MPSSRWGLRRGGERSARVEEPDGVASRTGDGEVGENLADDWDELEAVSGESTSDGYLGMLRVGPDDEVLVRGVRVQAGHRAEEPIGQAGHDCP